MAATRPEMAPDVGMTVPGSHFAVCFFLFKCSSAEDGPLADTHSSAMTRRGVERRARQRGRGASRGSLSQTRKAGRDGSQGSLHRPPHCWGGGTRRCTKEIPKERGLHLPP